MSQMSSFEMQQGLPGSDRLGVMDAARLSGRLVRQDLWRLWLLVLAVNGILWGAAMVAQCFGMVPFIGGMVSTAIGLAIGVFGQPPLMAGLIYGIRRRIDGGAVRIGDLFEGFKQRYWESVVAQLPLLAVGFLVGIVLAVIIIAAIFSVMAGTDGHPERLFEGPAKTPAILLCVGAGAAMLLVILGVWVVQLFLVFALVAVWDCPGRYLEAIFRSARLVWGHFWSALGLTILFGLVMLAVLLVSALPLAGLTVFGALTEKDWHHDFPLRFFVCLGAGVVLFYVMLLLISPAVVAWYNGAIIYLYRSWTGQALVQPPASPGPLPPMDGGRIPGR